MSELWTDMCAEFERLDLQLDDCRPNATMPITLTDDARKHSIASIKRYFLEELDQDIGELKAGLVLEFFLAEIAPTVYNGAIADAQTFLRDRLVDLEATCAVPEFAHWPSGSVRRKSRG